MRKLFWCFCVLMLGFTGMNQAMSQRVSINDFKVLEGKWNGKLIYRDYSSAKLIEIRSGALINILDKESFEFASYYPDEPSHNGKEIYRLNQEGKLLNDKKVIAREHETGQSLKIIMEENGTDGNDQQEAVFQYIWEISAGNFSVTKLVKRKSDQQFFQRSKYEFIR